ncbi:MAG: hypothetical protein LBQ46_00355 [Treponema sp.]|jgi:hypothetical protein|nr:hypothetical protein [Treponema sp.]
MKTKTSAFFLFLILSSPLWGEGPVFSGILDSSLKLAAPSGEETFSYGLEEYANLRLQQDMGERIVFYAALNCIAAAGIPASAGGAGTSAGTAGGTLSPGENYAAALELERLYMKVRGDSFDAEGGLLRLAFGYAQVWGPSDFLNPRNPLIPDARPRAVLGGGLSWYPGDMSMLRIFAAAPRDSVNPSGAGSFFGAMTELHLARASIQALYAYESPGSGGNIPNPWGLHRGGLSLKLDLALGLTADILYTLDPARGGDEKGLAASAGFDYSFGGGDWYVLGEYLYRGEEADNPRDLENQHYLYGELLYRYSEYTSCSLGGILALEDLSVMPQFRAETEFLQGLSFILLCRVPLAPYRSGGELGPGKTGAYAIIDARIRLRF